MLFYVLHEFFKHFQHDPREYERIQREWFQTVEDILYACVRETKNIEDGKKRLFKTLARWEELNLYPSKMKTWKSIVLGEIKPKRAPIRLPKNEAERLAEFFAMEAENTCEFVDGNLASRKHEIAPPNLIDLNRSTCPFLYERKDVEPKSEARKQWRFTAIAYIDVLGQCLVLNREVVLSACSYFHRIFDCGIYAQERFKVAAACLFLAAKAASKRMKLIRMVRTMHDILEKPLMMGDEDKLELERLHLLHYEIQVLQGIQYELTVDMPFYYLRKVLEGIPSKSLSDASVELSFWLPICLSMSPRYLAETAIYIACQQADRIFSFKWCRADKRHRVLSDRQARDVLNEYRSLCAWKRTQERNFNELVNWGREHGKDKVEAFAAQRGGLHLVLDNIRNENEFTRSEASRSSESEESNHRGKSEHSKRDRYAERPRHQRESIERETRSPRSKRERSDSFESSSYRRRKRESQHRDNSYEREKYRRKGSRSRSRGTSRAPRGERSENRKRSEYTSTRPNTSSRHSYRESPSRSRQRVRQSRRSSSRDRDDTREEKSRYESPYRRRRSKDQDNCIWTFPAIYSSHASFGDQEIRKDATLRAT
ncbi:unnamed protein product [Albugo candida]|uniref:Cyclin N-terminal domain-containing protein n=1 Tax=Albugo candida TaxID=65357 RepID=A0A024G8V4_9STRA|nr:unnamed protein product [Albugo candida]CCI46627.1 unnamed protein product [Albugo candida]CCI49103.1 unnamed protein product [Albugo candida]|eukprot:CCI43099.1 unnamed protein product [Albugo candida]